MKLSPALVLLWRPAVRLFPALPALTVLAAAAPEDNLPRLKDLKPELQPSWWEQNGWIVIAAFLALCLAVAFWRWRAGKKLPPTPVSPADRARLALEAIRTRPEDPATLTEISRILRDYALAKRALPPREVHTGELATLLKEDAAAPAGWAGQLIQLLRECDERKFSPGAAATPLKAAERGLDLVSRREAAAPPPTPAPTVAT